MPRMGMSNPFPRRSELAGFVPADGRALRTEVARTTMKVTSPPADSHGTAIGVDRMK
jgi:hypothetical protein